MILNRNKTRTILDTTETTDETSSITSNALAFVFLTSQKFYVGFQGRFASRYFDMGVANTNAATLTVKYFDGSVFTAVEDLVDQTSGMTQSGFISWLNSSDWQPNEQVPVTSSTGERLKLFWIEITTDTNFSAGTTLQSVLNLFSDDQTVRALQPEIITDTRFLPPGRTDFLEQHLEAKNRVVRRLIQKRVIEVEAQIIDANAVSEAASWAFVDIVLSPVSVSDDLIILRDNARDTFEAELSRVNLNIDSSEDGIVSDSEERINGGFLFRR